MNPSSEHQIDKLRVLTLNVFGHFADWTATKWAIQWDDSYHWIGPQYHKPMKMSRQEFDVEVWNPYYKKLHPVSNASATPKPKPDDLWTRDENGHITGIKNWNP
ncbi:MAG TPA: hypothetical protein VF207_02040 [Chthoniobacterales bacterium]|jgi:hypothetical protein